MNTMTNDLFNLPYIDNNKEKLVIPSLTQGVDFTKNQNKIKEGFTSNYENNQSQLKKSIQQYSDFQSDFKTDVVNYSQRIDPKTNPYLNKTIRFTTGHICYVTNQGVVKYVPSMDIWKSANIPENFIEIKLPYLDSYQTLGTLIPTSPPLISGSNVIMNQTFGNEGSSVFVNQMNTNIQSKYIGCYANDKTNSLMSFVGGSPSDIVITVNIPNGTFSEPNLGNNRWEYITGNKVPGWHFGQAALLNNAGAWGYPTPYPNGQQCVSLQNTGYVNTIINLSSGVNYTLKFYACGRNCCTGQLSNPINVQLYTTSNTFISTIFNIQPSINKWNEYTVNFTVTRTESYKLYFSGTTSSGDQSSAIQDIRLSYSSSSKGKYTYNDCKQMAIQKGFQYFSLQNTDSITGLGFCAVSNDYNKITSKGRRYFSKKVLWHSGTGGTSAAYAILSDDGTLSVRDNNNKIYWSSPRDKSCDTYYEEHIKKDAPGNDIDHKRGITVGDCKTMCNNNSRCEGFAYVPKWRACWIKNNGLLNVGYNEIVNLYKKTKKTCNHFLILQTDGNMVIYKGTEPNNNQGHVWNTATHNGNPGKNSRYEAKKGKFGVEFMKTNQVLFKGEWLGSSDGRRLLRMEKDGNLILYEFTINCNKTNIDGEDVFYANKITNAIYSTNSVGIKENMGKIAYVDGDSNLHVYPEKDILYSDAYSTVYKNTSVTGNDIPNASSNVTNVNDCMSSCNKRTDCNAFVYDTTGPSPICLPKKLPGKDIYSPNIFNPTIGKMSYLRDKKVIVPPAGINSKINNIDSIKYSKYVNGRKINNKLLLGKNESERLNNLYKNMNQPASQIIQDTRNLGKFSKEGFEGFEGFGGFGGLTQQEIPKKFFTPLLQTYQIKDKIKQLKDNEEIMDNILTDTNIKILQQNYSYIAWSILALASLLLTMKIKNS